MRKYCQTHPWRNLDEYSIRLIKEFSTMYSIYFWENTSRIASERKNSSETFDIPSTIGMFRVIKFVA